MLFDFWRRRHDIQEELEIHIELEAQLLIERGFTPAEAMEEARRRFGNRTVAAEQTREAWVSTWFDRGWNDLRYAIRTSRRNPTFTIAAALSIALGVGSATAVFAIADAVFLRPLPYPHPDELISVGVRFPAMPIEFLSSPDYVAWRRDNKSFSSMAATQAGEPQRTLLNGPGASEVQMARVSANFLTTLGVPVFRGRDFFVNDELPGAPGTAILSHRFWTEHYHGDANVIGRSVSLDGRSYSVIGILPAAFSFPADAKVDMLATLPVSPSASHHDRSMSIWVCFARLKHGVTVDEARADLERLFALSKADLPVMFRSDTALAVEPLALHRTRNAHTVFLVLLVTVSSLLLISCANVANLLLGRWAARNSELAIRSALGAGRRRLTRQLVTEIAVLSIAGSMLGAFFAAAAIRAFVHWAGAGVPRLSEIALDGRVLAIGVAVATSVTFLFGLLPSLVARQTDLRNSLAHSPAGHRKAGFSTLRRLLIAGEVALSVLLLTVAALLLQTLWNLRNHQLGFEAEHALSISIPVKGTAAEKQQSESAARFLEFLQRIPGTIAAAQSECTPLGGAPMHITFTRSDRPLPKPFDRGNGMQICAAGLDYDRASGQHIIRGRFFTPADAAHPQTLCVINETAARAFLPGENPIGKRILGGRAADWKTVIGVISDSKNNGLNAPPAPLALLNEPARDAQRLIFLLRTAADPKVLRSSIAAELKSYDSGLIANYETLDEMMRKASSGPSFDAFLIASFAALAFAMTVVGIYGVLSFTTAARTYELGIRLALGAEPHRLFATVVMEGLLLAIGGAAVGAGGALLLASHLRTLVYGVTATDAVTYTGAVLALLAVAALAAAVPARRAASINPASALRHI